MSTTNDFGYDYVFELAKQLSPEERDRLIRELEKGRKKTGELAPGHSTPTKEEMEEKRQKLIRLSLECPVATEEEIREIEENMKNFRKEFNESFERRLG